MLEAYTIEYNQLLLDELNILYVAFTRPSDRLYILSETQQPSAKDGFFTQINQPVAKSVELWNDDLITESSKEFIDRKSTRLNSSHVRISYAVFCLKKKKTET